MCRLEAKPSIHRIEDLRDVLSGSDRRRARGHSGILHPAGLHLSPTSDLRFGNDNLEK